jgi:hypothetical protein
MSLQHHLPDHASVFKSLRQNSLRNGTGNCLVVSREFSAKNREFSRRSRELTGCSPGARQSD